MKLEDYKKLVKELKDEILKLTKDQIKLKHDYKEAQRKGAFGFIWNNDPHAEGQKITGLHILYNRIRKRTPHTGSFESDELHLSNNSYTNYFTYNAYAHYHDMIVTKYKIKDVMNITIEEENGDE
jgi:hypothetical protein